VMTLSRLLGLSDGEELVFVDLSSRGALSGLAEFLLGGQHTLLAYESLIVPRCLQKGLETDP
jgi:hypothetical protein